MHVGRPAALLDRLHDELDRALQADVHALTDDEVLDAAADVYRCEAQLARSRPGWSASSTPARPTPPSVPRPPCNGSSTAVGSPVDGPGPTCCWRVRCDTCRSRRRSSPMATSARRTPPAIAQQHRNPRTEAASSATKECWRRTRPSCRGSRSRRSWRTGPSGSTPTAPSSTPRPGGPDAGCTCHARSTVSGSSTACSTPSTARSSTSALRRVEQELFAAERAEITEPLTGDALAKALNRTPAQRRADALAELARRAMAAAPGARKPTPLVTILVGYETFAGRVCELADGTVLAPSDVSALLDEAVIERAVFDSPARVTEISEQRCFTGALRRAIQLHDRECTHPYCDRPAERCDVDHVQPAAANGPTVQTNGRAACPFHNHLRQRRGPPGGDW